MLKNKNPPEKGEETGIAMDNMKPSGSCPEKNEVVVVVVGTDPLVSPVNVYTKTKLSVHGRRGGQGKEERQSCQDKFGVALGCLLALQRWPGGNDFSWVVRNLALAHRTKVTKAIWLFSVVPGSPPS